MTVMPPPATAPATTAYFTGAARFRNQGREIRDGRVVVEGGEQHGDGHHRKGREAREHGCDPPRLKPAVHDEACEEESDEERGPQVDLVLVRLRGLNEKARKKETADEERGEVRRRHREDDERPDAPP